MEHYNINSSLGYRKGAVCDTNEALSYMYCLLGHMNGALCDKNGALSDSNGALG